MAGKNLKDLKRLSPQERIKRLKELQEKDKKEIEEAQKLIKESQEEAVHEEELKKIPVPQLRAINIDDLFSPEEKDLFKSYRFFEKIKESTAEELEAKIKKEKINISEQEREKIVREEQERIVQYGRRLAERPAGELYEMARDVRSEVSQRGYINQEQQDRLAALEYAENKKMRDIQAGRYALDSEAANAMIMTQRIKNQLQEMYEAGTSYKRAA